MQNRKKRTEFTAANRPVTGRELKRYRKAQGLKQGKMASELGVQQSKLSEYESGKRPIPLYIEKSFRRLQKMQLPSYRAIEKKAIRLLAKSPDDPRVLEAKHRADIPFEYLPQKKRSPLTELCFLLWEEDEMPISLNKKG
jgi:transcriptional regulator with XRE-family HTH domain